MSKMDILFLEIIEVRAFFKNPRHSTSGQKKKKYFMGRLSHFETSIFLILRKLFGGRDAC
jgi:hypothetical protein